MNFNDVIGRMNFVKRSVFPKRLKNLTFLALWHESAVDDSCYNSRKDTIICSLKQLINKRMRRASTNMFQI